MSASPRCLLGVWCHGGRAVTLSEKATGNANVTHSSIAVDIFFVSLVLLPGFTNMCSSSFAKENIPIFLNCYFH